MIIAVSHLTLSLDFWKCQEVVDSYSEKALEMTNLQPAMLLLTPFRQRSSVHGTEGPRSYSYYTWDQFSEMNFDK